MRREPRAADPKPGKGKGRSVVSRTPRHVLTATVRASQRELGDALSRARQAGAALFEAVTAGDRFEGYAALMIALTAAESESERLAGAGLDLAKGLGVPRAVAAQSTAPGASGTSSGTEAA